MKKTITATEQELQTEENKYNEALKQFEEKKKREEMEQKKKEAKVETNTATNTSAVTIEGLRDFTGTVEKTLKIMK